MKLRELAAVCVCLAGVTAVVAQEPAAGAFKNSLIAGLTMTL
jgi:hypothetical protein